MEEILSLRRWLSLTHNSAQGFLKYVPSIDHMLRPTRVPCRLVNLWPNLGAFMRPQKPSALFAGLKIRSRRKVCFGAIWKHDLHFIPLYLNAIRKLMLLNKFVVIHGHYRPSSLLKLQGTPGIGRRALTFTVYLRSIVSQFDTEPCIFRICYSIICSWIARW